MRKLIATTSLLALLGAPALAGGMAEPAMEPEVVKAETTHSSGGIIVPLLLLILVAAAVSSNGGGGTAQPSDRRIKTDLHWVGMKNGLPIYRYRYVGTAQRFEGVMAQDVIAKDPQAVTILSNGMMAVNYARLGMQLKIAA